MVRRGCTPNLWPPDQILALAGGRHNRRAHAQQIRKIFGVNRVDFSHAADSLGQFIGGDEPIFRMRDRPGGQVGGGME